MFTKFMKMKYKLPALGGEVRVCDVDVVAQSTVILTCYGYTSQEIPLAVLDAQQIPRSKPTDTMATIDPFLKLLGEKMELKIDVPKIWLFILGSKEDMSAASSFAALAMKDYDFVQSTYIPAKVEMLNNVNNCSVARNVPLLFFFKKGDEFVTLV